MNRFQWGAQEVQRLAGLVAGHFSGGRDVDREIEQSFRDSVASRYPGDAVLGEEFDGGLDWPESGWILDPIDGTSNFNAGFQGFAVSLAYACEGRVEMGWVVEPIRGTTWSAHRGQGAWKDGEIIACRGDASSSSALVAVSSWFRRKHPEPSQILSKRFKDRSLGTVALEMVYVADGTFVGGFWHDVRAWDMAASSLIVEEAGGHVAGLAGQPICFATGARLRDEKYTLLACSPAARERLASIVAPLSSLGLDQR